MMEDHEGEQAQRFGLIGHQLREEAGQADGLGAQRLAHQVDARARAIALRIPGGRGRTGSYCASAVAGASGVTRK